MGKQLFFIVTYFGVVNLLILTLILYSLYLLHEKHPGYSLKYNVFSFNEQFKALPDNNQQMESIAISHDARVDVLKEFFKRYKSPLADHADTIVKNADIYSIDYKLLPAIAMQESTLCKKIPKDSYNCWGFGIYGRKVTRFSSYDEAIETVSKTLAKQYVQQGLSNPEAIMTKYTPSSNGSWANTVSLIMNRINTAL